MSVFLNVLFSVHNIIYSLVIARASLVVAKVPVTSGCQGYSSGCQGMAVCVHACVHAPAHSVYMEQNKCRPEIYFISRVAKEQANANGDSFVASSHYGEACRELRS